MRRVRNAIVTISMSRIIGHRGARGLAPENTLTSLEEALHHGVHEIEIDVRVTKDGICVLNHDPFLHAASGSKLRWLRIAKYTYAELLEQRPDLATLEQAITLVDRRVPLVIEVKPRVPTESIISILKKFLANGWQPADFLIASFSQRALRALHKALPGIRLVVNERFSSVKGTWRARQVGATRIAINHHNMWWGMVRRLHRQGWQISTFSLNDPRKAARWKKHGLYGVITDYPDRFSRNEKTKG